MITVTTCGGDELILEDDGSWILLTAGWLPVAIAQLNEQGTWTITAPPIGSFTKPTEADAVQMLWALAGE